MPCMSHEALCELQGQLGSTPCSNVPNCAQHLHCVQQSAAWVAKGQVLSGASGL